MNNKGFSLPELLAVVAILGIISGIAVIAVTKHTADSKKQAYDTMRKSICESAQNIILDAPDKQVFINAGFSEEKAEQIANLYGEIRNQINDHSKAVEFNNIESLVKTGYLDSTVSPDNKGEDCNASMFRIGWINGKNDQFMCDVKLKCGDKWIDNDYIISN